jgi:hypothetical protein
MYLWRCGTGAGSREKVVAFAFEPLPLVIGVTGHCDLCDTDIPLLRKEVEAVFDRLERDYANPHAGAGLKQLPSGASKPAEGMPMIVLSTLAPGAEQLVAGIAIARGLRVIAPLPLPREQYRRDFEWDPDRPDTLMTFEAWMARPDLHKLFVGYEKGSLPEDVRLMGDKRNLQYRRAGTFIARHCDVLIALWDGKPDRTAGSAAEAVAFKRHGFPPDVSGSARASLDAPETGPVIHIVTPRAMKRDTAAAVSVRPWGAGPVARERDAARRLASAEHIAELDHDHVLWRAFEASIRQSRDFNRDAARLLASARGRTSAGQSFQQLFEVDPTKPETKAAGLKAGTLASRWCVLFAVADALARRRESVFRRGWGFIAGLALFAFACVEAFAQLAPALASGSRLSRQIVDLALLSGGIAAVTAIVILAAVAILHRHRERFLDYRALAEALRVAVFWTLAGVEGAASAWPVRMPGELAWVKTCLLRQDLCDKVAPAPAARMPLNETSYDWIRRVWVSGRLTSLQNMAARHLRSATWRVHGALAMAAVAAALLVFLLVLAGGAGAGPGEPARALLLFAIPVLPAVAAAVAGCTGTRAFHALARQHERMAALFARALAILPPAFDGTNADLVRDAVRTIGAEAMHETAAWVETCRGQGTGL